MAARFDALPESCISDIVVLATGPVLDESSLVCPPAATLLATQVWLLGLKALSRRTRLAVTPLADKHIGPSRALRPH